MSRVSLAAVIGLISGIALSACWNWSVEGRKCDVAGSATPPCSNDHYCTLQGACAELSTLTANDACELTRATLAAKLSSCMGGRAQDWLDSVVTDQFCTTYEASLSAGRLTFARDQWEPCREALLNADCADLGVRKAGQLLADCPVFAGTVSASGSCATDKDCLSGYCDTASGCPGSCRDFVAEDAACTETDVCALGTSCFSGSCRRYITSGTCDAGAGPCHPYTHYCSTGDECLPRQATGAPGCSPSGSNTFCEQQLTCAKSSSGTYHCEEGLPVDSPCTARANSCERFSACISRDGGPPQCTLLPGVGEGCGLSPPQNAMDPIFTCTKATCDVFQCVPYTAVGQPCTVSAQCEPTARCVGGVCRAELCP